MTPDKKTLYTKEWRALNFLRIGLRSWTQGIKPGMTFEFTILDVNATDAGVTLSGGVEVDNLTFRFRKFCDWVPYGFGTIDYPVPKQFVLNQVEVWVPGLNTRETIGKIFFEQLEGDWVCTKIEDGAELVREKLRLKLAEMSSSV